jgi:hypothetical protein
MRHAPRAKDGRRKTNGTIAGLPSFIVHNESIRGGAQERHPAERVDHSPAPYVAALATARRRAEALGQTRQRPWSIQGRHDYLLTNCVA